MSRRAPGPLVVAVGLLMLLVAPAASLGASASASPPRAAHRTTAVVHAKPDVRVYSVIYSLKGRYQSATNYQGSDQFCDGTGFQEVATFAENEVATVKVTQGKAGQHTFWTAQTKDGPLGSWSGDGSTVYDGDPCSAAHPETCSGQVTGESDHSGTGVSVATSTKKAVFQAELTDVPSEASGTNDDCQGGYYPVLGFGLPGAIGPYDTVRLSVPWSKLGRLAKGRSMTATAASTSTPSGYDVATCNGDPDCTGLLSGLVHTITIKRTR